MQFVIKAYDGEGMLDKRMEVRPCHFEGMEIMKEHILCAGGMLDKDGKMIGSLLVWQRKISAFLPYRPSIRTIYSRRRKTLNGLPKH